MDSVKKCGVVAFLDIVAEPLYQIDLRKLWSKIVTFKGLDSMYFEDFKKTAELIEKGIIDPGKVTSKIFPMEKIKEPLIIK